MIKIPIVRVACVVALVACGLPSPAISESAEIIYRENFEDTQVEDGAFVVGWSGTDFTFAPSASGYLFNPVDGGGEWLNSVPAELGGTFAVLPFGVLATVDTGEQFVAGQTYELSFTHFRRVDTDGLAMTASIGNSEEALASVTFEAVEELDSFVTRSVKYTATSSDAGQNIFLRFGESGTLANASQAGIDNIKLSRITPEPAKPAK